MLEISGKTILILGAGASGLAVLRLALCHGARPILLDSGTFSEARLAELHSLCSDTLTGEEALRWKGTCDLVVFSPGIPLLSPLGRLASSLGVPCLSEVSFGASFCRAPILAIT